jgi:hypothetical protein
VVAYRHVRIHATPDFRGFFTQVVRRFNAIGMQSREDAATNYPAGRRRSSGIGGRKSEIIFCKAGIDAFYASASPWQKVADRWQLRMR